MTDSAKYHKMKFQPGALWLGMSEEAVDCKCTGLGVSLHEQLWRRIPYQECSVELTARSMAEHKIGMHGTDPEIDWNRMRISQMEHLSQVYYTSLPKVTTQCPCLFTLCLGSYWTWNGLRNHFNRKHQEDRIKILEDPPPPLPKCDRFVIQSSCG